MEDLTDRIEQHPRYIIDEPAPVDFFKSHSALVKAILDSLKFNPKIHSIGLLGSWGSGKSTIVADLQKSLVGGHGPKRHAFFGYDAWVHQGDPLFVRHKASFMPGSLDKLGLTEGLMHAGEKLSSDFAVTTIRRWLTALETLGKSQREIAIRQLYSVAVDQSNSALFLSMADIGGISLATQSRVDLGNFAEKLFADLTRQKGGRTWLKENSRWLNKGSAKAKNLMRSRLFDVIKSKNSERREWANGMLSLLKE